MRVAVRARMTQGSVDPRGRPAILRQAVNYAATDFLPNGRDCSSRGDAQPMRRADVGLWADLVEPLETGHGNVDNAGIHYSGPSFW